MQQTTQMKQLFNDMSWKAVKLLNTIGSRTQGFNTKKFHVFAPMGRFQLESIYLYFPQSSQLVYTQGLFTSRLLSALVVEYTQNFPLAQ